MLIPFSFSQFYSNSLFISFYCAIDLPSHQQIRYSIAVKGNRYIIGIAIASGYNIPIPINPTREISTPINSYFQARPSPPRIKTPDKIIAIGVGSEFRLPSVAKSAIKKTNVNIISTRSKIRAILLKL